MAMTIVDFGIIAGIICGPISLLWFSLNTRMRRFEDQLDAHHMAFVSESTCKARMSESHGSINDIGRRVGKLEAKVLNGP